MQRWLINCLIIPLCYFQEFLGYSDKDLQERGRAQYHLLKERGNLPQYGTCWKAGVEYLEKGCRLLTENTQSEIALHFTNCFLSMSGHDIYNCQLDQKPNLRAICINSMSDRAFNVYTEFYTHTQNICGFLQGHVWQEIIAENTMMVGKKLKETAENQEGLLEAQKESLKLQESMIQHGRVLENVLDDLFLSFKQHEHILNILSRTVANLQDWLVGEMSWFDSVIFYTVSVILVFILTSSYRTCSARLLIYFLLFLNFLMERLLCSVYLFISDSDSSNLYSKVNNYIWLSRYGFLFVATFVLIYFTVVHKDYSKKQYEILCYIREQNCNILNILQSSPKTVPKNPDDSKEVYLNNFNENITSMNNSVKTTKYSKNIANELHLQYLKEVHVSPPTSCTAEVSSKNDLFNTSNEVTPMRNKHAFINGHNQSMKITNSFERYNLRSGRCIKLELV